MEQDPIRSLRQAVIAYTGQLGEKVAIARLSQEGFHVRRFSDVLGGAELARRKRVGSKVVGADFYPTSKMMRSDFWAGGSRHSLITASRS